MALHLRPWNTNFIKLCSVRYHATSTSTGGAKLDVKSADNRVQSRPSHEEVMHAVHVHDVHSNLHDEVPSDPKDRSGGLALLPQLLVSETRRLTSSLLPSEWCGTNVHDARPKVPKVPDPSFICESCWHSDAYQIQKDRKAPAEIPVPSKISTTKKLENVSALDQLLMGNILHPVSYTADDIVVQDSVTSAVVRPWRSVDDIPKRTACECEISDTDTIASPGAKHPVGLVTDLIVRETTPITVIPFEDVPKEVCEPSCDKCDGGSQIEQKHVAMPFVDHGMVVEYLCSSAGEESAENDESNARLLEMKEKISSEFLKFFTKVHDYRLYHRDMIFENNYWGEEKVYRGLNAYAWQLNRIKMGAHFKFSNVKFHVLKVTHHEEDNTVKVRWRINGLPALTSFLKFWRFLPGQYSNAVEKESEWHDGFSIFYIGNDGLIQKHRVDRWMLDESPVETKKTGVAAALAILIGLIPRPSLGDINTFMTSKKPALPPSL